MSLEQEVELIRQFPIFARIQPAMQKLLCFSAERLTFSAGQVMFKAGDMGDAAYIVIEGKVEISVPSSSGPIVVNMVGRNEIIGEIAIFGDVPRTATATAVTRLETLRISRSFSPRSSARTPTPRSSSSACSPRGSPTLPLSSRARSAPSPGPERARKRCSEPGIRVRGSDTA